MSKRKDYSWVIQEKVFARKLLPGPVLVYNHQLKRAVILSYDGTQILLNGEYVDVGDDYTQYLAVMDAASEAFPNLVLSEPYSE